MDQEWLRQIFFGAGEVQDSYMPIKRSIFQNQKFGFVAYSTRIEGIKVFNMWNEATIRDHQLLVELERY